MSCGWNTAIDKLMIWSSNSWSRFDQTLSSNVTLRIYYDQLLLTTDKKIIESFNMTKIKGVSKGDVLILIVSTGLQIRKLKFQLKTNASQCLIKLGEHFPIVSHDKLQPAQTISPKFRQIEDIFKEALTINNDQGLLASLPTPPDYENFIKLCLLDPSFPRLVSETAKILPIKRE